MFMKWTDYKVIEVVNFNSYDEAKSHALFNLDHDFLVRTSFKTDGMSCTYTVISWKYRGGFNGSRT